MAKLFLLHFLVVLGLALTCKTSATNYMVGDSSGWDISTDLDSWPQGKTFVVGDVLMFQYSSSNSVDEVTKQEFDSCNTTNPVRTFSNGNTTVTLTKPGPVYFVSGNRLYCLGGMKLQIDVQGNPASSPAGASQAQPGGGSAITQPSSKSNNPVVLNSSPPFVNARRSSFAIAFCCSIAALLYGWY